MEGRDMYEPEHPWLDAAIVYAIPVGLILCSFYLFALAVGDMLP